MTSEPIVRYNDHDIFSSSKKKIQSNLLHICKWCGELNIKSPVNNKDAHKLVRFPIHYSITMKIARSNTV